MPTPNLPLPFPLPILPSRDSRSRPAFRRAVARRMIQYLSGLIAMVLPGLSSLGAGEPAPAKARSEVLNIGAGSKVGFTLMDPGAVGVRFTNELRGDMALTNAVAHNGAGLAIGDVDDG